LKVLIVNSVCSTGSTGRICAELAAEYKEQGNEVKIAYGRGDAAQAFNDVAVKIGGKLNPYLHGIESYLFDAHGLGSVRATKRFLKWAQEYDPDILWLHNIHGYYINYPLLFEWIKSRPSMTVKWTLHDCWAFTGHCSYFTIAGCEKWKTGCKSCPQPKKYPAHTFIDHSSRNYKRKKDAFCGVENMTVITPSKWLAGLLKDSFLCDYPVEVQYNSVDTEVFRPTESDFRLKYGIGDKHIILGVASPWDERKGLADFIALNKLIDDNYKIVLVGLTRKQIDSLPKGIIAFERTDSALELAQLYTASDVFFNPTYEDNYPTTNLEAAACGTPVVTYNSGGSPESAEAENVIPCGDVNSAWLRIQELLKVK
jgi:glycosyltransferase involved in cell wall biosynthesis